MQNSSPSQSEFECSDPLSCFPKSLLCVYNRLGRKQALVLNDTVFTGKLEQIAISQQCKPSRWLEVFVWSLAYSIVDAAPAGTNFVYFAFVNYATLDPTCL